MTTSQQIESGIRAELIAGAEQHVTPSDFFAWLVETGYSAEAVSAATGSDLVAVRNKRNAGNPFRENVTPEDVALYSKPVTAENFPGRPELWSVARPDAVLIARLSEALDASKDYWGDLYRKHLGREPDAAGLAWWRDRVERLFKESLTT